MHRTSRTFKLSRELPNTKPEYFTLNLWKTRHAQLCRTRLYIYVNYHTVRPRAYYYTTSYRWRYSQSRRPHGSRPFHDLTGSIPLFHHSVSEAANGRMISGSHSCRWLCESCCESDKSDAAIRMAVNEIFLDFQVTE